MVPAGLQPFDPIAVAASIGTAEDVISIGFRDDADAERSVTFSYVGAASIGCFARSVASATPDPGARA